jgi:D-galactonate transporter
MRDPFSSGTSQLQPDRDLAASTRAAYRKVSWRLIPFLGLCYLVAYLDRVNVGFAKLQMSGDLHFSETVYGLGAGIFFIGYFLFEVPSNLLLHRVGARLWIARIMVSWGLVSMAMMLVDSVAMFYAMRFLLGVAEAGFFPGIILYLTYWYPARRRGRITALFMSAVALSGVIGGPISGWILDTMSGVRGLAGWQWLFLLEGLPAVLLGVVVLFYLPDRIGNANWLDGTERRLLQANIDAEDHEKPTVPVLTVLRSARTWHLGAIYFCLVAGLYGVGFWLPTLIRNTGVENLLHIGFLNALPYAVAVVGMLLIAHSADARRERRWHVAIPAALGALGLSLTTWWSHDSVVAIAALSLATLGIISALPLFWSLPTATLTGMGAAAGIGLINAIGNLAGFASPYLVGWLKDATQAYGGGILVLAGLLLLGAWLTLRIPADATRGADNPDGPSD